MATFGLHVRGEDVPNADVEEDPANTRGPVNMKTQQVCGSDVSIMVSTRGAGWHTLPHKHDCEQINYVIAGEGWFFIEEEGFYFHPGDFIRVPKNEMHWSWIREAGVEFIQVHAPCVDIPIRDEFRAYLLREGEEKPTLVPNIFPSPAEAEALMRRVEMKFVGETFQ